MGEKIVNALIDGGKATPAPPLGPSLAVFKVNIGKIIQDINEKTKDYEGMKVPVKITIDDVTKEYKIEIGTPPVSSLIRKELGLKKIAPEKKAEESTEAGVEEEEKPKKKEPEKVKKVEEGPEAEEKAEETPKKEEPEERVIVGNLTIDQCIKIAKMKKDSLLAKDMKKAVKEIVASCVSMPITVENKSPKEVLVEVDEGKYDNKILG
ncbi:MAG: 50S ribosomal protein L11 [Candidatus Wukongarchaeota archaeon]|nr:50S ribosomal protein L11 [Candidatus Wukongarchaeota archaeon]